MTANTADRVEVISPEETAEQFIQAAIDSAPEQLRRLGQFLANVLDEDEWMTADHLLTGAAVALAKREAALRARVAELDGALSAVAKMRREVTTEYDGRAYLECSSCGCSLSEGEPHDEDCAWPIIDAALRAKGGEHG